VSASARPRGPEGSRALSGGPTVTGGDGRAAMAAMRGLCRPAARGWRAVDFDQEALRVVESCGQGELSRPKSGRARTVPIVEQVDHALMKLAGRERHTQPADLVFPRLHLRLAGDQLRLDRPAPGVERATPASMRRCATWTTRAAPTTRGCSPMPSALTAMPGAGPSLGSVSAPSVR